jgi:hypothetical protein
MQPSPIRETIAPCDPSFTFFMLMLKPKPDSLRVHFGEGFSEKITRSPRF